MSINTIKVGTRRDLTNPQSFLDSQSAAVLMRQGINGIAGWVFDIPTGETVDLNSDITEHYTESGSFVEDHIVLKPIQITLTGFKGELIYTRPVKNSFQDAATVLASVLSMVPAYANPLTPQASAKAARVITQAQYIAKQAEDIQKRGSNLVKFFTGDDNSQNLQQKAFSQISALWNSKQIVTVQTPWTYFDNMAIVNIGFKQDANSNDYTDITVVLKEMRFVNVETTTFDSGAYKSAIDAQKAAPADNGQAQGSEVTGDSALYKAIAVPLLGAPK